MILRRLAEHMRAQNWTVVALEFVMIVVGVFLGIQMSNWNAERQDQVKRSLIEIRLQDDFRFIGEELDSAEAYSRNVLWSLGTLREAIERGAVEADEDETIKYAIRRGYSHPTFVRHSPTYSELVASGRLDLVEDQALRVALARYEEQARNRVFNLQQIRNLIDRLDLYVPLHATLAPLDPDGTAVRPVVAYEISAMAADGEYRTKLDQLIDLMGWMHSNLVFQQEDVAAVMSHLRPQGR